MKEFISIFEQLPDKGKDIVGITASGDICHVFRCNCHNPNCKEWRCSISGYALCIDIIEWKYDDI